MHLKCPVLQGHWVQGGDRSQQEQGDSSRQMSPRLSCTSALSVPPLNAFNPPAQGAGSCHPAPLRAALGAEDRGDGLWKVQAAEEDEEENVEPRTAVTSR